MAGGRLVADRMLPGTAPTTDERDRFAATVSDKPGSCGYAANVRPFTRLRRFGADGRLQWSWDLAREKMALALPDGDAPCLSPSGTRLLVRAFAVPEDMVDLSQAIEANGVVAVGRDGHGWVRARPAPGKEAFASPRRTGAIGWRRGRPATLIYEIAADTETPGKAEADYSIPPAR